MGAGAQPSLGGGISLRTGVLPAGLAPFAELRFRLEARPARGFGEMPAADPSDLLVRFRPGLFWRQNDDSVLIQGQGALADPLNRPAYPNSKHLEFHQLYYNRAGLLHGGLDIRAGRQELSYGEERLIGPSNWTNTGRTFDGVRAVFGRPGQTVDVFYAHTANFQAPQPMFYLGGIYGSRTFPRSGTTDLYLLTKTNDGGKQLNRCTAGGRWKRSLGAAAVSAWKAPGREGQTSRRRARRRAASARTPGISP